MEAQMGQIIIDISMEKNLDRFRGNFSFYWKSFAEIELLPKIPQIKWNNFKQKNSRET
jgi:hypothetical protein